MATITVYSTPNCMQCRSTKKRLTSLGLDFVEVDLSVDTEAMEMVKARGFSAAPIVAAGDQMWSGFQPERLDALAA